MTLQLKSFPSCKGFLWGQPILAAAAIFGGAWLRLRSSSVKFCHQKPSSLANRLADSRGSSLVEFSLVAFMLLMVIFGVVEISRLVLVYTDVANAAREGTRYASVHGSDTTTDIQTVTQNALKAAPVNAANATITVTSAGAIGGTVSVTVAYPYDPFTTYFPLSVTLHSTSEGVIVY